MIPAGVIADGNIFDISAWVIPPMRYGESGILTSEVNPIVNNAIISGIYFIEENNKYTQNSIFFYKKIQILYPFLCKKI